MTTNNSSGDDPQVPTDPSDRAALRGQILSQFQGNTTAVTPSPYLNSAGQDIRVDPNQLIDAAGGIGQLALDLQDKAVAILSPSSLDFGNDTATSAADDFAGSWNTGMEVILGGQATLENGLRQAADDFLGYDVDMGYQIRALGGKIYG